MIWKRSAITLCILLTATMLHAQRPQLNGALGANFNAEYQDLNYADLRAADVKWIRGFLVMTRANPEDIGDSLAVTSSLGARDKGYHVVLTLKWNFTKTGIPGPRSPRFRKQVKALQALLPLVMGKVDALEIGNEPYWETPKDERDYHINQFYEAMAKEVIAYKQSHCGSNCSTAIFMGALNKLNSPAVRDLPWVQRWLAFAKATPEIEGVDIHPHVSSFDLSLPFVDYVVQRLRPDQKFLVTEFSLVWRWKEHMHDRVPKKFAKQFGVS